MALEDFNPSEKHVKLRTVLLILSIVVAIAAFAYGAYTLTNKKPGDYTITAEAAKDCLYYASDFECIYPLTGTSNEIKAKLNDITNIYASSMERVYKLTDPSTEYEGYTNLATINKAIWEKGSYKGEVSEELFDFLTDAYIKTEENFGYSLFGGAVIDFWETLLSLEDPIPFDPVKNPGEADRLLRLASVSADFTAFTVSFDKGSHSVSISVSEPKYAKIKALEEPISLLNFGVLRDAYRVQAVIDAFSEKGYDTPRIRTEKGIFVSLEKDLTPSFILYKMKEGKISEGETVKVSHGSVVASSLRSFSTPSENLMGYIVTDEDTDYLRNHWYRSSDGAFTGYKDSSLLISYEPDVVSCVYHHYILFLSSDEAVEEERSLFMNTGEWTYRYLKKE